MSLRYTLHPINPNPELKSKTKPLAVSINQGKGAEKKPLEDFGRWFGSNLAGIFLQIQDIALKDIE